MFTWEKVYEVWPKKVELMKGESNLRMMQRCVIVTIMWSTSNDYYLIDYHSCNRLFKILLEVIVIVIVIALANFYDYIPDLDA